MTTAYDWRDSAVWCKLDRFEEGEVTAPDGARIRFQSFGRGFPIVLSNGIGVLHPGLVLQIAQLRRRYRVITWDYRGQGESRLPAPDGDVSIPAQASDVLAILDHLGLPSAVLIGWSLGVQVNLEVARLRPSVVKAFVALFGSYGRPFETGLPAPMAKAVEAFWRALLAAPRVADVMLDLAVRLPQVSVPLLTAGGFIAPATRKDVFLSNVRDVAEADRRTYLRTMLELGRHDAWDVLPTLTAPALIIAGERDYLTPPKVAHEMAAAMPDARCVVLGDAAHFGLIEEGQPVAKHLDDFLADVL